ncbi:MAG: hypothetical protein E7325_07250 [Clostridiales bacterium]|nr:hypothetical protein [Clostridiales bacterium]
MNSIGTRQTRKKQTKQRTSTGRICFLITLCIMLSALCGTSLGEASQDSLPLLPGISWTNTLEEMQNALQRKGSQSQNERTKSIVFNDLESRELNRYFNLYTVEESVYNVFRMALYEIDLTRTINLRPAKSAAQTVADANSLLNRFYGNQLETFSSNLTDLSSYDAIMAVTLEKDNYAFLSGALNAVRTMIVNVYGNDFLNRITDYRCLIAPDSTLIVSVYSDLPGSDQHMYLFLSKPGSFFENSEASVSPSIIPDIHFQEDYPTVLQKLHSIAQIIEAEENALIFAVVDGKYCINNSPTNTFLGFGSDTKLSQIIQILPMENSSSFETLLNSFQEKHGRYEKITGEEYLAAIRNQLSSPIDEVYTWVVDRTILYLAPATEESSCYIIQTIMNQ